MGLYPRVELTILLALARTSLFVDGESDSSAFRAAFHSSSATGVLWATHVPKTSKNKTRRGSVFAISSFYLDPDPTELTKIDRGYAERSLKSNLRLFARCLFVYI
jgi:hypothetical protein